MGKKFTLWASALMLVVGVMTALSIKPTLAAVKCPGGETAESLAECPDMATDCGSGGAAGTDCVEPVYTTPMEFPTSDPVHSGAVTDDPMNKPADSETNCADGDADTNCAEDEEEEGEPEMWPVYLSGGAIAVTLLIIIVLAISSRKNKK